MGGSVQGVPMASQMLGTLRPGPQTAMATLEPSGKCQGH